MATRREYGTGQDMSELTSPARTQSCVISKPETGRRGTDTLNRWRRGERCDVTDPKLMFRDRHRASYSYDGPTAHHGAVLAMRALAPSSRTHRKLAILNRVDVAITTRHNYAVLHSPQPHNCKEYWGGRQLNSDSDGVARRLEHENLCERMGRGERQGKRVWRRASLFAVDNGRSSLMSVCSRLDASPVRPLYQAPALSMRRVLRGPS
eukprot:scaffold17808_cov33-Tisochrysis_lutea.AAC.2